MKTLLRWAAITVWLTVFLTGCNDATSIGADLLDEDITQVSFTDSLQIRTSTVSGDTALVYSPFTAFSAYLCGTLNDPIFGRSSSTIYAQFLPPNGSSPDFTNREIDSIVLVLPYDTAGSYGNFNKPITLEAFRLAQDAPRTEAYYSNASFAINPAPIGQRTTTPTFDSLSVRDYRQGTRQTIRFPHLRIPLNSLEREIRGVDSLTYSSDSLFLDQFKGLAIRAAAGAESMLSFNLQSSLAGVYIYYSQDTIAGQFQFIFNDYSTKLSAFNHDQTNAVLKPYLNRTPAADGSPVFVQGMAGVLGQIVLPSVTQLKGKIINRAELVLHVQTLPEDLATTFPPAQQIILFYRNSDGRLVVIPDISFAGERIPLIFGGIPLPGSVTTPISYRLNLTNHFQAMVNGVAGNDLYLRVFPRAERASRSVFFGAGYPQYGMKLNIVYTDPGR
ncbi:MAG: DUF4270 family protein [Lewinellaceae bacterium]|nr:DUF4270 family protein [Lewinellaceae bacterium]